MIEQAEQRGGNEAAARRVHIAVPERRLAAHGDAVKATMPSGATR